MHLEIWLLHTHLPSTQAYSEMYSQVSAKISATNFPHGSATHQTSKDLTVLSTGLDFIFDTKYLWISGLAHRGRANAIISPPPYLIQISWFRWAVQKFLHGAALERFTEKNKTAYPSVTFREILVVVYLNYSGKNKKLLRVCVQQWYHSFNGVTNL